MRPIPRRNGGRVGDDPARAWRACRSTRTRAYGRSRSFYGERGDSWVIGGEEMTSGRSAARRTASQAGEYIYLLAERGSGRTWNINIALYGASKSSYFSLRFSSGTRITRVTYVYLCRDALRRAVRSNELPGGGRERRVALGIGRISGINARE